MKWANNEVVETDDKEKEFQAGHDKSKRKRDKEDDDKLPEFLEIVERFDISETAASQVFNLFSEKKKLSQCQINKKKKKARIEMTRKFTVKKVNAVGFDERKDISSSKTGQGSRSVKLKLWSPMVVRRY